MERVSSATSAEPTQAVPVPRRRPMLPWRILALSALAATFAMAGLQVVRLVDGQGRTGLLTWGPLVALVITAVGTLLWTWNVAENVRRLAISQTQDPISPSAVVASWAMPMTVVVGAGVCVFALQQRLDGSAQEASPLPLAVALAALILTMIVVYKPVAELSAVMRRLGGTMLELARWYWVPITLAIVGTASLFGMRALGAFEDSTASGIEGVVPLWALGVVAVPPSLVALLLGWNGASAVEYAIEVAYDRRAGRPAGIGRSGRIGLLTRALRADARPAIPRDRRKLIRLVPGAELVRGAVVAVAAALALVSIVGALVMFLFWREGQDGFVSQLQRDRAWDALAALSDLERLLAVAMIGVATLWTFVNVTNIRLATGRRRNPFLAAAAWPAAAWGVWAIGRDLDPDGSASSVITVFGAQIAVMAIPFFLLSRAAVSAGAQLGPIRLVAALAAVLIVHIQGLAGLSTLEVVTETDRFGRLAGYLALAAVLELLAVMAISQASQSLSDSAANEAERHNFLVEQRGAIDVRLAGRDQPAPTVGDAAAPTHTGAAPAVPTPAATPAPVPPPPPVAPAVTIAASRPPDPPSTA